MNAVLKESLNKFRQEIQEMCFHWKSTKRHGHCQIANGMDHVCCFCELVERLDVILLEGVVAILNERKS